MARVVLGGDGLARFATRGLTDHYVKLLFPVPGVQYPERFDLRELRAELPPAQWPSTRTYTVRRWDSDARELSLDFLLHGDHGLAGKWAAHARPGDTLAFTGPGGGYRPDPEADWHLMAGDASALPAIAASLEALPAGARAHVFIEVADADDEQPLDTPGDASITWLHQSEQPPGDALMRAVTAFRFPPGTPHAFVHGEAGAVKQLRRLLRLDRSVPLDRLSISGYWRLGQDEDGWQSAKRDWNRQVEAEQEATAPHAGA